MQVRVTQQPINPLDGVLGLRRSRQGPAQGGQAQAALAQQGSHHVEQCLPAFGMNQGE